MRQLSPSSLLTSLFSVILIAACSNDHQSRSEDSIDLSETGGAVIVGNSGEPRYSGQLFGLREHVRIKEVDAHRESLLTMPRWMGIDDKNTVYVIDVTPGTGNPRIVVYDESGEFMNVIGHSGQGPGEYVDPQIVSLSDGIVTVFDPPLNRISHFSSDGTLLRVITLAPWQDGRVDCAYVDPVGVEIGIYRTSLGDGWYIKKVITRTPAGQILAHMELPQTRLGQMLELGNGSWSFESPLNGMASIAYVPGRGILMTSGEDPALHWYDLTGKPTRIYDLGLRRQPVTNADLALVHQFFEKRYLNGAELGQRLMKAWQEQVDIPNVRGYWISAQVDESGFIWLEDPRSVFDPAKRTYLVVSPSGEYLGICALPQGLGRISRGHYLLISVDEDDGTYSLVAYQLEPAADNLDYP